MNDDLRGLERALRNRKSELQRLISQMKTDRLDESSVFRNLHRELQSIDEKLQHSKERGKS